jgi:aminopeptidase 2
VTWQLLALVIGDLEALPSSGVEEGAPVVTLYAPPGSLSPGSGTGERGLNLAVRALRFYGETFAAEYPLPKLDLVAVPEFASGAMENWGLILFQPQKLLCRDERVVADCVLHEVAHQWLGNLVTPPGWNELWLKEGLAVWAAAYAMEHLLDTDDGDDSDSWAHFVGDSMQQALELDSLLMAARPVHPAACAATAGSGASAMFDAISYRKGACLVRMVEGMIGRESLLEGFRRYVREYKWANAGTEAFWVALATPEFPDLAQRMRVWTAVPGFPVVRAWVEEGEDDSSGVLRLTQELFISTPDSASRSNDSSHYPLQVTVVTKSGETKVEVPGLGAPGVSVPLPSRSTFWAVNPRCDSFCRVVYPEQHLQRLLRGETALGRIHRIGLLGDAAALCRAGYTTTTTFLDAIRALSASFRESEMGWTVWKHMVEYLGEMLVTFRSREEGNLLRRLEEFSWHYVLRHLCNFWSKASYEREGGDDDVGSMMHRTISKLMWETGAERFIIRCGGDDGREGHTRYMPLIFSSTAELQAALNRVSSHTASPEARFEALECLGYILCPDTVAELLTWLIDPGNVQVQEVGRSRAYLFAPRLMPDTRLTLV